MVIFQEVDMREKLRDLSIIDLLLMYLWYEKDDTNWALTIGHGSSSRIQEEQEVVDRDVKHRQSLWVDVFIRHDY